MKASKKADGKMAKAEPKADKPILGSIHDGTETWNQRFGPIITAAQAKFPECFENLSYKDDGPGTISEAGAAGALARSLIFEERYAANFAAAFKKQHQMLQRILAKMGEAPETAHCPVAFMPPAPFDISILIQNSMSHLAGSLKQLRSSERILRAALAYYECRDAAKPL